MGLISYVMWMFLVCYMINHNNGGVAAKRLSNLEDLEIKKQFKLVNKPAVKIIKTIYGEKYGCVDFYKQPAFDDPSLKNHTFDYKMRPTSYPEGFRENKASNKTLGFIWENGVGCPIGTVPIRRVTKEEFIRMNSLTDKYNPRPSSELPGYHYAVTRTTGTDRRYTGATMDIALYNPTPVQGRQFSSSRMHIQIGDDEFIQAGWTVHPMLYSDTQTRLYVYTQAGGTGCYNSLCSAGLVLVRQDIPLGLVFQPLSQRGRSVHYENFAIFKDQVNGNWWLELYGGQQVGFWPANKFRQSTGTKVEWGGEVFSDSSPSPPMGNGHFPEGNPKWDSFVARISTVDDKFQTDKTVGNTESYTDNSNGYKVRDAIKSWFKNAGHLIVYGGPGNI